MRRVGCLTALATMSHCEQASYVIETIGLKDQFEFVATRDDVEKGKPAPQTYSIASEELKVPAAECLVIEDSATGVEAAISARMHCIAVATPFTLRGLRSPTILGADWLVDAPNNLAAVAGRLGVGTG